MNNYQVIVLLVALNVANAVSISIDADEVEKSTTTRCKEGFEWKDCGTACPKTCLNPSPGKCTKQCVRGCFCKPGLLRHGDKCYKPKKCPCTGRFVYKDCGTACPKTCERPRPRPCTEQCVPGCFCKKGYVLKDGKACVPLKECPCTKGAKYKKCGTACPPTCGNPKPHCTLQCVEGCFCSKDLVLHKCKCIKPGDCPVCGTNEKWYDCGGCEGTCDDPKPRCPKICKEGACQCKQNFVRAPNGKCIPKDDCPKCGPNQKLYPCVYESKTCNDLADLNIAIVVDVAVSAYYYFSSNESITPTDLLINETTPGDVFGNETVIWEPEETALNETVETSVNATNGRSLSCRVGVCGCKPGFILLNKDSKVCVPETKCPQCPMNMKLYPCNHCDPTCKDPVLKCNRCPRICKPGECICGCKPGYVLQHANSNKCIPVRQCFDCKENEEFKLCVCDNTCKISRKCPLQCYNPGCGCKDGYVRDRKRRCIKRSRCP